MCVFKLLLRILIVEIGRLRMKSIVLALVASVFLLGVMQMVWATSGPYINLPSAPINVRVEYPSSQCYYYVHLSNVPAGYHVSDGRYLGWCVDEYHYVYNGKTYTATLYSSYDANNPHPDEDWDKVNYILNHKQGTWRDVQEAIWRFVDGGNMPSSDAGKAMVADADANGEGFVPAPGQVMAVVVWINSNTQVPIIEVAVPLQNVVPEYPFGPILGLASFAVAAGIFKRKYA